MPTELKPLTDLPKAEARMPERAPRNFNRMLPKRPYQMQTDRTQGKQRIRSR